MTQGGARSWLPKGAFSLEAAGGCLSATLAAWSERWFVRPSAAIAAVRPGEPIPAARAPLNLLVNGAHAALEVSGHGKRRLLEAALDVDLAAQTLSDGDRRLLDSFVRRIVEDLAAALDELLGGEPECEGHAAVVCLVTLSGHDVLNLEIAEHALARLIKARSASAGPQAQPLVGRWDAFRGTQLDLYGFLGRAELSLTEVVNIGIGDVVILDRLLTEPVELRLANSGATLSRGLLRQSGGHMSIQL